MVGLHAIDWVLKNSLAAGSNVGKDEQNSPTPKSVIRFAGAALLTTLGLSLASNPFISTELAGDSYLPKFNQEIVAGVKRIFLISAAMHGFVAMRVGCNGIILCRIKRLKIKILHKILFVIL